MHEVQQLISGRWISSEDGPLIEILNPADDKPVSRAAVANAADVEEAVRGARDATALWARTPPAERSRALTRAAAAVEDDADQLAQLATAEMGRPLAQSRAGVAAAVSTMREYAGLGLVHRGHVLAGFHSAVDFMTHEPRGVVAVITPWNDPVAVAGGLLAAALVTGNTVVHKPSERSSATGELLVRLIARELPEGVLSLLTGDGGVGARLAAAPVDVVAHVGSSTAGRSIAAACARTGAKAILENGGSDPMIVDADVDPVWAAGQAAVGAFANSGQLCTSVERIYLHQAVAAEFTAALVHRALDLRVGAGYLASVEFGPLVDRRHREQVHAQVRQAQLGGARVLCGAAIPDGPGSFYPPTVLADCDDDMAVVRQETFGPVAPIVLVDSFDEGLRLAAASPYGLAATVLSDSMRHVQQAWRRLPVGTVKINAVFGGAPGGAAQPRAASGDGFGYGPELLDEMTAVKAVHISPAQPRFA